MLGDHIQIAIDHTHRKLAYLSSYRLLGW